MLRQYVKDCIYPPPPIICNIHWANNVCQKRKFSDMASKWNNLSRIKWKEEEKRCVTFSFLMNLKLSLFFKSLAFYLLFFFLLVQFLQARQGEVVPLEPINSNGLACLRKMNVCFLLWHVCFYSSKQEGRRRSVVCY